MVAFMALIAGCVDPIASLWKSSYFLTSIRVIWFVVLDPLGDPVSTLGGRQIRLAVDKVSSYFFRLVDGNGAGSTFGLIGGLVEAGRSNPFVRFQGRTDRVSIRPALKA